MISFNAFSNYICFKVSHCNKTKCFIVPTVYNLSGYATCTITKNKKNYRIKKEKFC